MHRFRRSDEAEAVFQVLSGLPTRLRRLLAPVRFVTGYDPAFLGIHFLGRSTDGRAYASTSHCVWPHALMHRPADDRRVTIFLQGGHAHHPHVVLHELGHALDWRIGWHRQRVVPLDAYAARNPAEAFATAFQSWATTEPLERYAYYHDRAFLLDRDPRTAALFERLTGAA